MTAYKTSHRVPPVPKHKTQHQIPHMLEWQKNTALNHCVETLNAAIWYPLLCGDPFHSVSERDFKWKGVAI